MTSMSKKRKCHHNIYTNGSEKRSLSRSKGMAMFHKKNRVANKRMCRERETAMQTVSDALPSAKVGEGMSFNTLKSIVEKG